MKVLTFKSSQGALGKVGSEKAPELVLKELKELYLSESGRVLNVEKFDVEVDNSNIFTSGENLEIAFKKNYSHSRIVVVGGDHSMTYFSFKAFASRENNSGLIIFDAHPDCMENFKVTHEDFVRVLIDENILNSKNIILVGLRNWHKNEYAYLKSKRITYFTMEQVFNDYQDVCDTIMENIRSWGNTYVSVDIDFLDPAFAPGTGYLEAGGASTRELLYFLKRIKMINSVKAFDLVEIIPDKIKKELQLKLVQKY